MTTPKGGGFLRFNKINNSTGAGGQEVAQCYGIYSDNSEPTIIGNEISGGTAGSGASDTGKLSYGLYIVGNGSQTVDVAGNTIAGGVGYTSYTVYTSNIDIDLYNNLVLAGRTWSEGINYTIYTNTSGIVTIRNNTITLGRADSTSSKGYAIFLNNADTSIDNNIFLFVDGSSTFDTWGIYEQIDTCPASLKNNDFHNFDLTASSYEIIYHDASGDGDILTITGMETDINSESAGTADSNITADPVLDENYRPTVSSPPAVVTGGLDGAAAGWGFTTDRDGITRTGTSGSGWSMGCYEYD
jgi:hypothetical protein